MLDLQPPRHTSTLRIPDGSSRRLADLADHGAGRLSFGGFAVIQIKAEGGSVTAPHGRL